MLDAFSDQAPGHSEKMLAKVQLIVFEMSGKNQTNIFTKVWQEKIAGLGYPAFIKGIR